MKYWKLTVLAMTAITVSSPAQNAGNHNPAFSVPNTFIGGEPYIFIGENDGEVFEPRTPVGLQLRNPPGKDEPYNGSTTLQWSSSSSGVLAFDEEDSMTGFKEEDRETGTAKTDGPWTWTNDNQANFHDDTVYLQGSASAEPGTVTLESFHSEDPNDKFTKDLTLLKVDLEASEYAEQSPFIGASRSDSLALPFQLDQSEEESEGITLGVNNDDDDLSGIADMTQIAGDTNVSGENDSAAVRIRFSAIDSINNGTVSIELKKTSGEFGTRLWKDRFDKSHTMLVAAATTGIELTPADSNADIGINGSANGATTKSWDLSDSTEKADLLDIINNRKVLWLEGLSTGEGEIALKLEIGGAEVFEDKIKVTVVESKTVKNQTVAYADAVKNTHFGAVSNSDSVRNYHGGDDVIIPIAFYPGAESRSEPTTYDVVAPSERNSLKAIMDSRGLRAYVVSSIVDQAGQPSAGGFAYADIGALVIIADAGDVEYVHEYTHLRGQIEHTCVTDNYMWGDG